MMIHLQNDMILAKQYQKDLIFAALEDFSAIDLMSNFCGGQYGPAETDWRTGVSDFIYLNLMGKLIQIKPGTDIVPIDVAPAELRSNFLAKSVDEDSVLWMGLQFKATPQLVGLVQECGLLSWESLNADVNLNLIEKLMSSYTTEWPKS